ncbi:protease complex subunit PrcB family protein [Thermohalobacter berrensis]|uniref:PrcB C-terminal domain-containing protein n=1 Tax=Thermohalobacter berrensis TaxID=99594 RepID=A0A419T3T1_9FIRM|nr:protease complex subunit PrcB family protein [Thermohalobacter berrensis]RKD32073.1 hypothetical protein BET03_11380 [Thermohalobacter berrensis]
MKRKLSIYLIILSLSILSVGCNSHENTSNSISYEILQDSMPEYLEGTIETIKTQKGFTVLQSENDKDILFISLGEKPTAGYNIKLETIKVENDKISVIIEEVEPKKGEMVAQVITYPFVLVKFDENIEGKIQVSNTTGNTFSKIDI